MAFAAVHVKLKILLCGTLCDFVHHLLSFVHTLSALLRDKFVNYLIRELENFIALKMDMHHGSVRRLYASFEASPLKSMELSGHNDGNLDKRINGHPTSEAYVQSTNGIETKFVNEVNDRPLKSNIVQPIAVIGMALRFPQDATSPEKFWEMLMDGRSARTEVPKERYNVDSYYRSDSSLPETVIISRSNWLKFLIPRQADGHPR